MSQVDFIEKWEGPRAKKVELMVNNKNLEVTYHFFCWERMLTAIDIKYHENKEELNITADDEKGVIVEHNGSRFYIETRLKSMFKRFSKENENDIYLAFLNEKTSFDGLLS